MDEATQIQAKVVTIATDNTVAEAATKMRTNRVACLVVTDEYDQFVGIVTEQDIVCRAVSSHADIEEMTVAEIMTQQLISCSPRTHTSKVREIMAANRIRHLPIVEHGVVVGMFSIRDVLEQQLVEDRVAAEQIAVLSNCLKSMDLNEIADTITTELPRLFQAQKCVLCLHRNREAIQAPAIVSFNGCICSEEDLACLEDTNKLCDNCEFRHDSVPRICEKQGAESPHLVISVNTSSSKEDSSGQDNPLSGYLCMCGLAPSTAENKDLISYKAKLVSVILNSHLASAILYQHARLTSLTDPLTEVGSRKLLEDKLESECARAKRYQRSFTVAIIDLDNFKAVNDTLGHAAGDNALRQLAKCMKHSQRAADVLARYGGDEFVLLMPETKAKDALVLLERLRTKVQEMRVAENVSMTISCGAAEWLPGTTDSASEVRRRADLALYEAKSTGRNCVRVWDETMSQLLKGADTEKEKIKRLRRRIGGSSC
jgi:diguanylate cyclase (GGDEF)-like protein